MNIQNPSKWVGKYVRHMKNWQDFQWAYDEGFFVCEETGRLTKASEEAYYGDVFASYEDACVAGYDECYSYSEAGLYQLWQKAYKNGKVA